MNKEYVCSGCGKQITDWDDVEFTGDALILTYKCECGRYEALIHNITLEHVATIDEGSCDERI
jgi:hypothetical protein